MLYVFLLLYLFSVVDKRQTEQNVSDSHRMIRGISPDLSFRLRILEAWLQGVVCDALYIFVDVRRRYHERNVCVPLCGMFRRGIQLEAAEPEPNTI